MHWWWCTVVHCSAALNTFKHVLFDELVSQKENTHIFPAVSVNFTSSLIYCFSQCVTFLVGVVYKNSSIKLVISYLFPPCLLHCCFSTTLFSTVTHLRRLTPGSFPVFHQQVSTQVKFLIKGFLELLGKGKGLIRLVLVSELK